MDFSKEKFSVQSCVKSVYHAFYPTDETYNSMRYDVTFGQVMQALREGKEIYKTIFFDGSGDSIVRERIFEILAYLYKTDYDTIYYLWLRPECKSKVA